MAAPAAHAGERDQSLCYYYAQVLADMSGGLQGFPQVAVQVEVAAVQSANQVNTVP